MLLEPRIQTIAGKTLLGKRSLMSFADNRTKALWQSFMPVSASILNKCGGADLYSVEIYPAGFFEHFNPLTVFEKWAAVEVSDAGENSQGFETLTLPGGTYAVFGYRGAASAAAPFYRQIFDSWLPGSGYSIDDRPHFAVMGEKYRHEDDASEEDIWIPIRPR